MNLAGTTSGAVQKSVGRVVNGEDVVVHQRGGSTNDHRRGRRSVVSGRDATDQQRRIPVHRSTGRTTDHSFLPSFIRVTVGCSACVVAAMVSGVVRWSSQPPLQWRQGSSVGTGSVEGGGEPSTQPFIHHHHQGTRQNNRSGLLFWRLVAMAGYDSAKTTRKEF